MDKKEVRLNANKRKSLVIDFRKHCESLDTHEKEAFLQSRDDAKSTIESSFATCKEVVQRRFPLEDVATLQTLQKKHNTINAVGEDSCFFFKVTDAPKVLDIYNDEVDKSRHFSFELDGSLNSDYGSRYSGSSNSGKNFAYAMYREDMKAVGLNPDCNIENDVNNVSANDRGYRTNPYLSQCRNDNQAFLSGKSDGGTNYFQSWKDKYQLDIIGTGGCRSRAIPCTDSEFAQFELMHIAKANLVKTHTAWVSTMLTQVKHLERGLKLMTKFSQVEDFAKKFNWTIAPEILADKMGMDLVISIDDAVDSIMNIGKKAPSREEKIKARILYNAQQSSLAS